MIKGSGGGGEGGGDLGVRFDKLNELRVGEVPDPDEGCRKERGILLYGVPLAGVMHKLGLHYLETIIIWKSVVWSRQPRSI